MEKSLFQKTIDEVLGGLAPETLIAAICWALVGLFISMLMEGATRNPLKDATPVEWSWRVFFSDKVVRFFKSVTLAILVIVFTIRFMEDLIGQFSMFYSGLVGFFLDDVKEKWRQLRTNFKNLSGKLFTKQS
jgi:hypothetical protein